MLQNFFKKALVVLVLARREYTERIGRLPSSEVMLDITAGVLSVIPDDL
jgi:hypothetical protein